MNFEQFSRKINEQFNEMSKQQLFTVDISRTEVWETYMNAFTPSMNPVYKTRTDHDCNCCKNFIRDVGSCVTIGDNGEYTTIWDIAVDDEYQLIADTMSKALKAKPIRSIYAHYQANVGALQTLQHMADGSVKTWNHFVCKVPSRFVTGDLKAVVGKSNTKAYLLKKALSTLSKEAVEEVLMLVEDNNLYRGAEYKNALTAFLSLLEASKKIKSVNTFAHVNANNVAASIANSVIGTLLLDLSEGVPIENAVASFENKVSGTNYKRPKSLVSAKMITDAQVKFEELGLTSALNRRLAVTSDIAIDDVLFVDRAIAKGMKGSFTDLLKDVAKKKRHDSDAAYTQISMDNFLKDVVPNSESVDIRMSRDLLDSAVTLIAPVGDAANMFLWDNNFSWSYKGNVADSAISTRVKKAGGDIEGYLRVSLGWSNSDDLDINCVLPGDAGKIAFSNKSCKGGKLDVDMNAGSIRNSVDPVENIVFKHKKDLIDGMYEFNVVNYTRRTRDNQGFQIELEIDGTVMQFQSDHNESTNGVIKVYVHKGEVEFQDSSLVAHVGSSKGTNVSVDEFEPVNLACYSPNYWGDNAVGNKHLFLFIDGMRATEEPRGFYNEFIKPELHEHRKVLEVLGSQTKCQLGSEEELTGIGISMTRKITIIARADGRQYEVTN